MATNNFLDQAGLSYLWTKILSAIESHSVTLPDKLVSYKAAMTITATEKLNADTLGGYSATYFAKGADVSIIQETIRTQASEILKAQQAVSSMESTVSSLAKNKANSVHAAQHAKGGADPITPESIGAAPGGFGWGNQLDFVQSQDGVTTYADFCGMIDGVVDTMPVNTAKLIVARGPTETGQYYGAHNMLAILNVGNTSASVTLTGLVPGLNSQGSRWRMVKAGGTWGDPEWVNPPMDLNTEYRTTERYLGKPVYVKVVNCGSLPNNDMLTVKHGIANIDMIVDAKAIASNSTTGYNGRALFPQIYNNSLKDRWTNYLVAANSGDILIYCGGGLAGGSVYVTMRYTKTTD